jgi:hypothetical protein
VWSFRLRSLTVNRIFVISDTVEKLNAAADDGGKCFRVYLDGYDQTVLFTGKSDKSARKFVFYYDETVLTTIRYESFKVTFSTT